MQTKSYNEYRITHKNGEVEVVCSTSIIEALENMETAEVTSPVLQVFMAKENIRTLVADEPTEVLFVTNAVTGGGSIATPASGTIHVGDTITLQAIPSEHYAFDHWSRNGVEISNQATFVYTMEELLEGEDTAVFTATFKSAPIEWTASVSPEGATGAGCVAFPLSGVAEEGDTLSLIAVEAEGFTFSHWERNGNNLGTSKILETEVSQLAEGEATCVYTAVYEAD